MTQPTKRTLIDTLDGIKDKLGELGLDGPYDGMGAIEILASAVADPLGPSLWGAVTDAAAAVSASLDRVAAALDNIAQAISRSA